MEDSFKARVERLFGSHLFEKVPRSAFPESSWSVVEGEVEKKEWNRKAGEEHPNREETPLASSYSECFSKSSRRPRNSERRRFVEDLEDEEDLEEEKDEGEGIEDEERDIRSSIGLDSTLDFEEEEDEYDRAAVGMADVSERLYMKDVKDHGPFINYHLIMEDAGEVHSFNHDPRADHAAASVRLQEDQEATASLADSLPKRKSPEGDVNLKPILKRKTEELAESRPKKQVRFDPSSKEDHCQDEPSAMVDSRTPDYIRNPSKYICYSLESEGVDEESNRCAFADFWELIKGQKSKQVELGPEIPQSIAFTPRKRADNREVKAESSNVAVRMVNVAAAEALEDEILLAETDETEVVEERGSGLQMPSRRYRSRRSADD